MQLLMMPKHERQTTTSLIEKSPYAITIESASWGINCRTYTTDTSEKDPYLQQTSNEPKLKENNVLFKLSQLCNGRVKCDISLESGVLGSDPSPDCGYKRLQVEYRCFTVDHLRKIDSAENTVTIDCDKQFSN